MNLLQDFISGSILIAFTGVLVPDMFPKMELASLPTSFSGGFSNDDLDLQAHGGLTYNSYDNNNNWVIGFDCAHYQDLSPYFLLNEEEKYSFGQRGTYRDMKYVKSECENLAEQASKFSKSIVRYNKISQII